MSQPSGTLKTGITRRGSRRDPGLPVTQHLLPSRFRMASRDIGSGAGGFFPRVTGNSTISCVMRERANEANSHEIQLRTASETLALRLVADAVLAGR